MPIGADPTPNCAFWRKQLPGRPIEPIETEDHDEAGGRYSENQRTCQCSIFLMFVVHNFSPNHSGCEQFSCECFRRHLFWFVTNR